MITDLVGKEFANDLVQCFRNFLNTSLLIDDDSISTPIYSLISIEIEESSQGNLLRKDGIKYPPARRYHTMARVYPVPFMSSDHKLLIPSLQPLNTCLMN